MEIIVRNKDVNLHLPFPNFVFTNRITFKVFLNTINAYIDLSVYEEEKLYHFLKKGVKMYHGLTLVEVKSHKGEYIKITL